MYAEDQGPLGQFAEKPTSRLILAYLLNSTLASVRIDELIQKKAAFQTASTIDQFEGVVGADYIEGVGVKAVPEPFPI
jgi:hypothetical protein